MQSKQTKTKNPKEKAKYENAEQNISLFEIIANRYVT